MSAAAESMLRPRPDGLLPFLLLSVVGHAVVLAGALLFSWAFSGPQVSLDAKPIRASLVRLGKKRDEKLLPRKDEAPLPPKQEKIVDVGPTPAPVKPAVAIPTKDAPKPAKAQDKASGQDSRKSLFDAFSKGGKATEVEGEETGDPNGDSATQEGERYFGVLSAAIRRNYDVSNTIDEAERRRLKAEVALRLGTAGELLAVSITKSSGNELFDSAVVGAVKNAAPFGPPPAHLRGPLKSDGVALVFTP